jgi:Glycosyl hydrolases family 16
MNQHVGTTSVRSVCLRMAVFAVTMSGPSLTAAVPSPDYELLFADDFDGEHLDLSHWRYRTGERGGVNMFRSLNRAENITVSGGKLRIAVRQEQMAGQLVNTGGGVISTHQFGYGYYECLSTPFMAGHGVHSAFWQSGGAPGKNNSIFEIDAYEIDSKVRMACHNLYVHISPKPYKEVPWVHRANVPIRLEADGSYLCAYEYTPQGVIFYSQGVVVAKAEWNELTAAQCLWLTALNGVGKVDGQPGESTFDYVRYYAKDWPGVNLLPNGSFEYNQDKTNPLRPVAWDQQATDNRSGQVLTGEAARDRYRLRQGLEDREHQTRTSQTLEFLRNGDYELTAQVRTQGDVRRARIVVSGHGGEPLILDLPRASSWTPVQVPRIPLTSHGVTIALESAGAAGSWVEYDDVRFQKPALAGQTPTQPAFQLIGDPIWRLAEREPITFTGDPKFYFFDRNVGCGDAISVVFTITPEMRANTMPIARAPKTGTAGWAVQLTEQGQVVLRIGSSATQDVLVADAQYVAGKPMTVACIVERGTARIAIDGKVIASRSGLTCTTTDTTAAGRLGNVSNVFDAVGDVMVQAAPGADPITGAIPRYKAYRGQLAQVRVYNRALSDTELGMQPLK